jgi:hypothetical protein
MSISGKPEIIMPISGKPEIIMPISGKPEIGEPALMDANGRASFGLGECCNSVLNARAAAAGRKGLRLPRRVPMVNLSRGH